MKRNNAFLLFEVLVAIMIATTSLVILMQGVGGALRASNISENYFIASMLAEGEMVLLEKEPSVKVGTDTGRFGDNQDPDGRFSWERSITPISTTGIFGVIEMPVCEVKLTVKWKQKNEERGFTLITYLLKYEETAAER